MHLIKKDDLLNLYCELEETRLKLFNLLANIVDTHSPVEINDIFEDLIITETYPNYIKITIREVLPREANIRGSLLRQHWYDLIFASLKGINYQTDKLLCVIRVVHTVALWDVDNRSYKYIIDALRYSNVIPNDTQRNISFMVTGSIDSKNPRTEIYLLEHPIDPEFFIKQ